MERAVRSVVGQRLFGQDPVATLALLRAAWATAVGDDLARRTEVIGLDRGTLRIKVPDPRWRKELHRMQRDILRRLRPIAGELTPHRLGFVESSSLVGPEVEPRAADVTPPSSAPAAASPDLVQSAGTILDPSLRERFLTTATRYLGRRERLHRKGHSL